MRHWTRGFCLRRRLSVYFGGSLMCIAAAALPQRTAYASGQSSAIPVLGEQHEEDVITALYACFRQGVEEGLGQGDTDFGPSSEMFFSEQLARASQVMGDAPRLAWCHPWFVEPYLRARHALQGASSRKGAQKQRHTLAASLALDAEGQLVVLASQETGGSHALDHAKMAQEALWGRKVGQRLKALAIGRQDQTLLVQAAQVPDLYQFSANLPHARSFGGDDQSDQTEFVTYVRDLMRLAQEDLLGGRRNYALVRLGMALHAVQDLMVYTGLSWADQAALSYSAGPLADVGPAVPIDPERWDRAVGASRQLLAAALSESNGFPVDREGAEQAAPAHEPAPALAELVVALGYDQQAVDFGQLRQFWRLGWQARQKNGTKAPDQAPSAQGSWDADSILTRILADF